MGLVEAQEIDGFLYFVFFLFIFFRKKIKMVGRKGSVTRSGRVYAASWRELRHIE